MTPAEFAALSDRHRLEWQRREAMAALAPWVFANANLDHRKHRPIPIESFMLSQQEPEPEVEAAAVQEHGWRQITRMLDQMYDQQQKRKPDG